MSSHYKAMTVRELYRPKDIIPTLFGIICTVALGVFAANFVTFYAGI